MRFWRNALSASSEMNRRVACFLIQDAIARPAVLCGSGVAHFRARRLLSVFLLPYTDDEITPPAQRQTSWLSNAMKPGGKGSLQGTTMFSHSTRDLSAIRFHSLGALILTILGVRVCPVVDTRFNFCAVWQCLPDPTPKFRPRWAQRCAPLKRDRWQAKFTRAGSRHCDAIKRIALPEYDRMRNVDQHTAGCHGAVGTGGMGWRRIGSRLSKMRYGANRGSFTARADPHL
jgi:hypothetical protein